MIQLTVVTAAALLLWRIFTESQPLGDDVGNLQTVAKIRADKSSPAVINPRADMTIIVFTDYQCPACRSSEPALQSAARRDGKITIVYKEWPVFGRRSEQAARVALASAHQGIYPAVHAALMSTTLDEPRLQEAVLNSGGDWRRLQTDLERYRKDIDAELADNETQAFSLGLDGTPAYLIGPILVKGALDEREFAKAIAAARTADRGRQTRGRSREPESSAQSQHHAPGADAQSSFRAMALIALRPDPNLAIASRFRSRSP